MMVFTNNGETSLWFGCLMSGLDLKVHCECVCVWGGGCAENTDPQTVTQGRGGGVEKGPFSLQPVIRSVVCSACLRCGDSVLCAFCAGH